MKPYFRSTILLAIFMFSYGCQKIPATNSDLPLEISVEEYRLQAAPTTEPMTFLPVEGTQSEILAFHQMEREKPPTLELSQVNADNCTKMSARLGDLVLVASITETVSEATNQGTFLTNVTVHITQDGREIYSVSAGDASPINNLRSLYGYNGHWVLEFAYITNTASADGGISSEAVGQIVFDGELLNEEYGYEEAFGFQLLNNKPFYFFKQGNRIGISYDGQDAILGYTLIPHYACCSAGELNPIFSRNMVSFFAQRDGSWYYVEIGVFN